MSLPTEFDFAVLKIGDGAAPEVFTIACGLRDGTVNAVANTSDRYVRDCAKPGEVPNRKVKTTGKQLDVTATGLTDKAQTTVFMAALGKVKNYKLEVLADDGSDAGVLLGTYAGAFVMTAANVAVPRDGESTAEVTLASHGAWTWTAAA